MKASRPPWARLRRFFDQRRPLTVAEAAGLLECDPAWLVSQLDELAAPSNEVEIPWTEAAPLVRQTLTPAELDVVAGRTAAFPALLRVVPVCLRLPAYLLVAIERLVAEERANDPVAARLTVEAYVARHLDLMLDPEVFERLCVDPEFRRAFHFPEDDE